MNDVLAKLFPYQGDFTERLLEHGMFSITMIIAVLLSLVLVGVFYYLINSPRFNKWHHWLLFLVIDFALIFLVATFYPKSFLADLDEYFDVGVCAMFGLMSAVYAALLFIIFSFSLKWWSTNASTTPI